MHIKCWFWKPEGRRSFGIPMRRREEIIRMDHGDRGWGVDWIHLAQGFDERRAVL